MFSKSEKPSITLLNPSKKLRNEIKVNKDKKKLTNETIRRLLVYSVHCVRCCLLKQARSYTYLRYQFITLFVHVGGEHKHLGVDLMPLQNQVVRIHFV